MVKNKNAIPFTVTQDYREIKILIMSSILSFLYQFIKYCWKQELLLWQPKSHCATVQQLKKDTVQVSEE